MRASLKVLILFLSMHPLRTPKRIKEFSYIRQDIFPKDEELFKKRLHLFHE